MTKKMTTDEFKLKASEVHGKRYDYSESVIINTKTKVKIVCQEHGLFEQTPANHLQGMGCLLCGFKNAGQYHKKDTKSFIEEAKAIHSDFYDYSLSQYKGAREKITIICPKHGNFEQVAHVHLRNSVGAGCERCSYEKRGEHSRMPFEEFRCRANEVHEGFYDYSAAEKEFASTTDKITIICTLHGPFLQTPSGHLAGRGCSACSASRLSYKFIKSNDAFIRDARKVHGDKYDYSKVEYAGAFIGVEISCPLDGVFVQSPTSHLSGIGCPKCSRRNQGAPRNLTRALRGEFDDGKEAFVYVVSFKLPCTNLFLYKIGSGTGSRMKTVINEIKRVGGYDPTISHCLFSSTGEAIVFEHLAHEQVRHHQFIVPIEFKFHGHSEVFVKSPILDALENHPTLTIFRSGKRWDPRVTNSSK
ncbi:DUF723 domain-containing protein [Sulfurirhabdus autotrophica]|uniref:Uncharacterized protein DUF723 n=1 Tax=Sulfurirhabdus autotrophica TaxID=1706046 RepID=A0A4R3Y7V8_9PROT|nr:DUF723 domain-containing protein [Sulfurirhabdus autotrophica]TCV86363.1 uncharacterized protein DUF723 [Sulfurirhabdus autotrophica]